MPDVDAAEAQVQDAVARADHARRARETAARLWAIAPLAAGACVAIAIAGRLRGWTPLVTLLALAGAALALAAFTVAARRRHAVSDADISHIDSDAGLQGELRSAHWFTRAADRDPWIQFHLANAAERVRGIDWAALYPAPRAGREKIATGVLAAAAIVLAIVIPGRAGVSASDKTVAAHAAAARRAGAIVALPADVRKQLEDMLAAAENGRALSATEVKDLLARLDDLAHTDPAKQGGPPAVNTPGQSASATKADVKALAERAKKAAESTSLEPQTRDALSDLAEKLNDGDQNANAMSSRDPQDAAAAKGDAAAAAQQSKSGGGNQGGSVQTAKEASGGSGVGVMMMTNDDASNARDGGMGLGGGTSDRNGGGHLVDLGAALKRETIDASVDNAGENVLTTERRKTEHADATTAYSHAAAQPAERGSSTAPPPVPESRRAAVKSYFIRKQ